MSETRPDDIPIRPDGLQLDEKRGFQDRFWSAQRIIWLAYVALLMAALAGLTGRGGPLAMQTGTAAEGSVELPRITRRGATDEVVVDFATAAPEHRLVLDRDFLAHFELDAVTPRPAGETALPDGTLLLFAASGPPPHRATLHVRVRNVGLARPVLELDGARLTFRTLILP